MATESKLFRKRQRDLQHLADLTSLELCEYSASNPYIPLEKNWSERWCTLGTRLAQYLDDILGLEVRESDVFVATFMKSGTTWMQEAAWLLLNNLDFEKAKQQYILDRSVFLEASGLQPVYENSIEACNKLPDPRLIKSHLPANLLPIQLWQKRTKTIYVARNVKDTIVSAYHFLKALSAWSGSIEQFAESFMKSELTFTPFWPHIVEFWQMRHEPFIYFVTYEEMQRDLATVLKRLCEFLQRPPLTDEELATLLEHLSFRKMKENKQTNISYKLKDTVPSFDRNFQFMRRGIVGSFKDELSIELQAKIDAWSAQELNKYGLKEEDIFG